MPETPLRAGVVGVGSMGENHARVYNEIGATELAGVSDADREQAAAVAAAYDTTAMDLDDLLAAVDVVSIAVPTAYHYETAAACIRAGVDVLVEKPFVGAPAEGRDLIDLAAEHGVALQVGHVERFNPAVGTLRDIVADLDVISVTARRLGPPPERDIGDTAVMDLMIHDVDVVLDIVEGELTDHDAVGTADGRYATATLSFDSGAVASLRASRVTQEKVRELTVSAAECRVRVDYIDQTVEIHRASTPEYLKEDGDVHYRHEDVVERVTVDREEPLKNELRSFAEAAATGTEPRVTGADGIDVLEVTRALDRQAAAAAADRSRPDIEAE